MITIKELIKLNLETSILYSNNSPLRFDNLFYIRVKKGKVKSDTTLKLIGIEFLATETI